MKMFTVAAPAWMLLLLGTCIQARADAVVVGEFLASHCTRCHGPKKAKAEVTLHTLELTGGLKPNQVLLWKRVHEQIENGDMPPDDEPQPTAAERQRVLNSIRAALHAAGEYVDPFSRLRPARGNRVDHDALFSSKPAVAGSSSDRVWRVSDEAYEQFMHRVIRDFRIDLNPRAIIPPWKLETSRDFADYSTSHRIGEAEIAIHHRNCERIALKVVSMVRKDPSPRIPLGALLTAGKSATRAQVDAVVKPFAEKLLNQPLSKEEIARYATFFHEALATEEPREAAEQFVVTVLSHPHVLYRIEPAQGPQRALLPPLHLARAISLTLTDREPDALLKNAATNGTLQSPEHARREVARILNDPKIEKPKIIGFFREYFGYTTAEEVFKCATTLKAMGVNKQDYQPYNYVADTDRLVMTVLAEDRQVLRELLTTRKTYVLSSRSPAAKRDPRFHKASVEKFGTETGQQLTFETYGVKITTEDWVAQRLAELPADQRMGLLTHPSWLIAHSTNFENHAIRRGRWIYEKLLGGTISEAPVTVNAALPDEPHHSLRERMRVVRNDYCWKCHQHMDPLGLPFEQFDHIGRYRTAELIVDREATAKIENDKRIRIKYPVMTKATLDTSGGPERSGDAKVDGSVKGPLELIRKLADSERAEQVFVRHVFRYFMGRNETPADGPTLVAAHRAYRDNDGSMKALLLSLLTSDAFLYRAKTE